MALSSTGTRKARDVQSRANDAITENDKNFIANLKLFSGESDPVAGVVGQGLNSSPNTPTGNYLAREGDSMIGPIALGPPSNFRVQIQTEENINISPNLQNPQFSSNIELDAIQPNGLVLDRIDGAAFDGQILVIRTFGPDSFTISQMTLANGGNIQTPDDEDFTLGPLQMIMLVFDEALVAFANTGGTWRVLAAAGTGGGGGTGTYTSVRMDQDQIANLALNDHIQFNDLVEDGGIVLQGQTPTFDQTSGIFELKEGVTYYLYGDATAEFTNVNDTAKIAWWDRTNGVQLGQTGSSFPFSNSSLISTKHSAQTIFTPATDVEVDLRIVALSGIITTIFFDDTQANIFEFSGSQGPAGPPGAAGGGLNWKIPARVNEDNNVANLAAFDVIVDGITLVQNERVLLTGQNTLSENGIYSVGVVALGIAPLTRTTDFDSNAEVVSESFVPIEEGDQHENELWHLISDNPLTVDVSDQVWKIFAPGSSGGPDMGGGEDGIDGAGEFVNDGRIGVSGQYLKIWETINITGNTPEQSMGNMIYLPTTVNTKIGRIMINGLSNATKGGAYSDNYGSTFQSSASLSSNNGYGRMAYAQFLTTDGTLTTIRTQTGFGSPQFKMLYSLDRGTSFTTTVMPDNGQDFVDQIWIQALGLFVAVAFGVTTNKAAAVYTSPDGITWTAQVTPLPVSNPLSGWFRIVYDSTTGIIYVKNNGTGIASSEHITSPDGINWSGPFTNDSPVGQPRRIIYSQGQKKFAMAGGTSIIYSEDFVTWTTSVIPGMSQIDDILYADDLSLWLAIGDNVASPASQRIFFASNDLVTWENFPATNIRVNSAQGVSNDRSQIVYAKEWGYFFGINTGFGADELLFRTSLKTG